MYLTNNQQTILVTGAKGMLGRDLCPMFEDEGYIVIETDKDTLDITNESQVLEVVSDVKPAYIIHCAGYTNVDKAEDESETAEIINAHGTGNVAKSAEANNSCLVYLSTDYVFDGTKNVPYEPNDITNPINKYGLSKLHGEEAVKKFCSKYYITRTSWLYGHHGKNFVETMIANADNTNLKVVNDQQGCPTWTVDLSKAIIDLIENKEEYGIYHLCGGGQTNWYEFAKEIFNFCDIKTNLQPCSSNEYIQKAQRPKYSVMNNDNRLRDWKLALKEYIELRIE